MGKFKKGGLKKAGKAFNDQTIIRTMKKAESRSPFPKKLSENRLEIGIRFLPD